MSFWAPSSGGGTPVALPLSHTNPLHIINVGVNTHAQIDTALGVLAAHVATTLIHVDHSTVSMTGTLSIAGGGDISATRSFALVGDVAAPGNNFFYGTTGAGVKGWNNLSTFVASAIAATTPALHAATHASGGTDPVNHNTLLNYVANQHVDHSAVAVTGGTSLTGGAAITASSVIMLVNDTLAPGNSFYYGTSGAGVKGFFALPAVNVTGMGQTEKDFGATPVYEAIFTVVDAAVTAGMRIMAELAYEAPTGRSLDECEMVDFDISSGQAVAGSFQMLVQSRDGLVAGLYKFSYTRG